MRYRIIRQRKKQRKRLAKTIKDARVIKDNIEPEKYNDMIQSLKNLIRHYPKLKQRN